MSKQTGPDVVVNTYGKTPPAAADARQGARSRADIQDAIAKRRELSREQSTGQGSRYARR
jgi:hypothetical protein